MDADFDADKQAHQSDAGKHSAGVHAALASLRSRAERRRYLVTQSVTPQTPQDVQRMMQELQVHQMELEMQYEELLLAQAEAQNARAQYVDLYDFAPVGYFTLTAAGIIHQLNLCGSQMLGSVRQRLVGRRFALFLPMQARAEFEQFLARIFTTERTVSFEMVLLREDGTPFYAQMEGLRVEDSPETTAAASPHCRLAVLDTTARRNATDALAASEARFRRLFTESNDAVVLLQGQAYVDCNNAALRLLGAAHKGDIVGQTMAAHAPVVQPDGRTTASLFRESIEEALRTGSRRCTARMHKLTGEEIWMEKVLTPIEQEGAHPLIHILWRDVTAERDAALQLRESEARLNLALQASETGVFTWDVTNNQLVWDARCQAIFGRPYSPEPVPSELLVDCSHPDDKERVVAATNAAIASRAPLAIDYRITWPDGSVHYVSSAGRGVSPEGGAYHFTGVLRDVTALYAAEAELHYKTMVLERLLSNMPLALARFRRDGTYLEAVGEGLRALGLHDNELVGRNVLDAFPSVKDYMQQVLSGQAVKFMAEVGTAEHPLAFQNFGFFDEQRQQGVVLSVDVTEAVEQKKQLKAEKEFTESLLENSVDGIVATDRTGVVTAWNTQAARYFGHAAAAVIGRPVFQALPRLDCAEARQVLAQVLAGEQVVLQGQAFEHRAGHYDAYYVPLHQNGSITGVLMMFRDVTERNRMTEEATQLRLRQQQDLLSAILTTQESERKRIAEALHNGLGQLLYAAKLSVEGRGGAAASPKATLELLHEAIQTTRTISFELTPGILEDFGLRTALEELSKRITPAGMTVNLHLSNLESRLRPQVEIAVYRIVQELLNNAMKHAHATEVVVHVAHENGRVEVSVEDNGTGFDPHALTDLPLAGMGLAGVRNRVALLGGQLQIDSRLGRGTIMSFEVDE